jgi:WD40 repeat protein
MTIRIWSMDDPKAAPAVLRGHESGVTSVAFNPNGRTLASGSMDGTVWLWTLDLDKLCRKACEIAGRNLTCEEWQQFFMDEPYSPICPDLPYPKDCGKK